MYQLKTVTPQQVHAAIDRRVAQLSFQLDIMRVVREVFLSRVGKRTDKRLQTLLQSKLEESGVIAARHAHLFPSITKKERYTDSAPEEFELRWYQSDSSSSDTVKVDMPSSRFPVVFTAEDVDKLYGYSGHPIAKLRQLEVLREYAKAPGVIDAAVRRWNQALQNLADAAYHAAPRDPVCLPNGEVDTDKSFDHGLVWPLSQLFPEPSLSARQHGEIE